MIDPAVEQINAHTDISISVTPMRKGRTVLGFAFSIRPNAQIPLDLPQVTDDAALMMIPAPNLSLIDRPQAVPDLSLMANAAYSAIER